MGGDDEQVRYLEEATRTVRQEGFYMKRAIDADDLQVALNHATAMLRELRTSLLTPKNYYDLYMKVLEELRELEEYFMTLQRGGKAMVELYESVQACGNVLPRLYLLFTVGGVYIRSKEVPAKDVLKDMVEMAKGVQHPMRGLFLRNYLAQVAKDKLPDAGSEYEGVGGTVTDACEFVLQNFAETTRLWVRLQNQGASKERKRREKERQDLRILVGTNLVRLSQLEGLDADLYETEVLPKVLEQVTACKDTIAQSYLMDCVIQVFPDDFHLRTLETFLNTCSELKEKVNVRGILESMMDRLASYATATGSSIPDGVDAFHMLNNCITQLIEKRTNLSLVEILRLHTALANFGLKAYPERTEYVNHCISTVATIITSVGYEPPVVEGTEPSSDETVVQLQALLAVPLTEMHLSVLQLENYAELVNILPWGNRKALSVDLLRAVLTHSAPIGSKDDCDKLFDLVAPLIKDPEGAATAETLGGDEEGKEDVVDPAFEEEQMLVAKTVHLMQHSDTDALFRIYLSARRHFGQGGVLRIRYTLVPLIFAALRLARAIRVREAEVAAAAEAAEEGAEPPAAPQFTVRKAFQFAHEIVTAMATRYPDLSLKLFLQCAQGADEAGFSAIAYEFVASSLTTYEDEVTDSRAQVRALDLFIGTLLNCRSFSAEDYDALITKVTQFSAKLLKKPAQCEMVAKCAHLFYREGEDGYKEPRRVMECLQRSLKIADVCAASSGTLDLFTMLLDKYLYHFEAGNPSIEARHLSGLLSLISEQLSRMEAGEAKTAAQVHFQNALRHIQSKSDDPKFAAVQMPSA